MGAGLLGHFGVEEGLSAVTGGLGFVGGLLGCGDAGLCVCDRVLCSLKLGVQTIELALGLLKLTIEFIDTRLRCVDGGGGIVNRCLSYGNRVCTVGFKQKRILRGGQESFGRRKLLICSRFLVLQVGDFGLLGVAHGQHRCSRSRGRVQFALRRVERILRLYQSRLS